MAVCYGTCRAGSSHYLALANGWLLWYMPGWLYPLPSISRWLYGTCRAGSIHYLALADGCYGTCWAGSSHYLALADGCMVHAGLALGIT